MPLASTILHRSLKLSRFTALKNTSFRSFHSRSALIGFTKFRCITFTPRHHQTWCGFLRKNKVRPKTYASDDMNVNQACIDRNSLPWLSSGYGTHYWRIQWPLIPVFVDICHWSQTPSLHTEKKLIRNTVVKWFTIGITLSNPFTLHLFRSRNRDRGGPNLAQNRILFPFTELGKWLDAGGCRYLKPRFTGSLPFLLMNALSFIGCWSSGWLSSRPSPSYS